MPLPDLINPAGGLYYHLKAARYKSLWTGFINEVYESLQKWNPPSDQLVIFGSSGGYCLKSEFLKKFKEVTIIDTDPLSKFFFSKNHHRIKIKFDNENYLSDGLVGLKKLNSKFNNQALLFSNILGQLPFILKKNSLDPKHLQELFAYELSKMNWASFHDVYSFHFRKKPRELCWPLVLQSETLEESIDSIRLQTHLRPLRLEAIDHQMSTIFSEFPRDKRVLWARTPYSHHVIDIYFHNY